MTDTFTAHVLENRSGGFAEVQSAKVPRIGNHGELIIETAQETVVYSPSAWVSFTYPTKPGRSVSF